MFCTETCLLLQMFLQLFQSKAEYFFEYLSQSAVKNIEWFTYYIMLKKKYLIIESFTLYLNATSHLSIFNQSVVSLPITRGPGVQMKDSVWEHRDFNNYIFLCDKVYFSNTIIITILM